jgi:hypothetical protein
MPDLIKAAGGSDGYLQFAAEVWRWYLAGEI